MNSTADVSFDYSISDDENVENVSPMKDVEVANEKLKKTPMAKCRSSLKQTPKTGEECLYEGSQKMLEQQRAK